MFRLWTFLDVRAKVIVYTGFSRAKLDDVHYLLDGLDQSQPTRVRRISAERLAAVLRNADTCLLVRANCGFAPIFDALAKAGATSAPSSDEVRAHAHPVDVEALSGCVGIATVLA